MKPAKVVRVIFAHFGLKILSLVIAVLLWISVSSEPELSTFATVPVQYKNMPEDLEISSDVVESIYLELQGPAGELRGPSEGRRYSVILDMSGVRPGQRTFTIGDENVALPRGLRLVRAIPSQLRFDFERRVSRQVPVEVQFAGKPPKGYELAGYQVWPETLPIEGPESRVAQVKTVKTDEIDLRQVVGPDEFRVNAFAKDPHVRFTVRPEVVVKVKVVKVGARG